jgi:hypothetical protein
MALKWLLIRICYTNYIVVPSEWIEKRLERIASVRLTTWESYLPELSKSPHFTRRSHHIYDDGAV